MGCKHCNFSSCRNSKYENKLVLNQLRLKKSYIKNLRKKDIFVSANKLEKTVEKRSEDKKPTTTTNNSGVTSVENKPNV